MAESVEYKGKKLSELTMDEYLVFKVEDRMSMAERTKQIANMPKLTSMVMSKDPDAELNACRLLGNIFKVPHGPWKEVKEADILKKLVIFLDRKELPQLQHEALGIISSYVDSSNYIDYLVHAGVVIWLADLKSLTDITSAMTITTLGKIAKTSPQHCQTVLDSGVLEQLLSQINKISDRQHTSWMLRLFCDKKPQLKSDSVNTIIDLLKEQLEFNNEEILVDTCWTLSSLCEVETGRIQVANVVVVCQMLIMLLRHPSPLIVEPALETLSNIASNDQTQIQRLMELRILPGLASILPTKYDDNVKKTTCKMICNIASIGSDHVQAVVGYGLVYALADMFTDGDVDVKLGVARAMSIVTSLGAKETVRFIGMKCMRPLCDMLYASDSKVVLSCLGGLKGILKAWHSNASDEDYEKFNSFLKLIKYENILGKIMDLGNDENAAVSQIAKEIEDMCWASIIS